MGSAGAGTKNLSVKVSSGQQTTYNISKIIGWEVQIVLVSYICIIHFKQGMSLSPCTNTIFSHFNVCERFMHVIPELIGKKIIPKDFVLSSVHWDIIHYAQKFYTILTFCTFFGHTLYDLTICRFFTPLTWPYVTRKKGSKSQLPCLVELLINWFTNHYWKGPY